MLSSCSHFDAVTSVAFHPTDPVLVTGSEDCTVKVWNLQKANQSKRSAQGKKKIITRKFALIIN